MAEIQKDTNKVTRKEPKETKKENKPDKSNLNRCVFGQVNPAKYR